MFEIIVDKDIVSGARKGKREPWNRCDECGRFIPYADFENGTATHYMVTPESPVSYETFETLCREHSKTNPCDRHVTEPCDRKPSTP